MRNGQNKRMRGRNRSKNHNPLTKVYESNGPDVKIRGTASHVAEKYIQLARDAQSSGDPVSAESYYQHAEHYFRMIAAAQEQFRQNPPFYGNNRPDGGNEMQNVGNDSRDGTGYDDEGDDEPALVSGEQPQFGTSDPQPYLPRDTQFYGNQPPQQPRQNHYNNNNNHGGPNGSDGNVDRLPSFITGAQPPSQQPTQQVTQGQDNAGERFQDDRGDRGDRFGYRRRRHRRGGGGGPRPEHNNGMRHDGGDDH